MRELFIVTFFYCCFSTTAVQAQSKYYQIEKHEGAEQIHFTLSATTGSWKVKPGKEQSNPVDVHYKLQNEALQPVFTHQMQDKICYASLSVKDPQSFGKRFSQKMLGIASGEDENQWEVILSNQLPFLMSLDYGMGDAYINLSDIPVKRFKVKTASANVQLDYEKGLHNLVDMDTFQVEVELGTVQIKKLNLARAQKIIADVGLGSLTLDFSDQLHNSSEVMATVGAGNLEILLPASDIPVIVRIVNSPLCRVKLQNDFAEIRDNVFVNESYDPYAKNILTFNVDVAMGKIEFKKKEL
jgi:hypothetical protein